MKGPAALDGGWGWVIVFAVFIGNCLFDGFIGSYGILYPEVKKMFDSSPVLASMVGSMVAGVYQVSSPAVGMLIQRYGCRHICFVGGCIGAGGFVLASLSQNMVMFMIAFGFIVGIGIGLNFLPGHVLTNAYFDKKRGVANGIVSSGAGFGVFILAPILQLLLNQYGLRGTLLISAGIFMQLIVCSTLMRPLRNNNYPKEETPSTSEQSDSEEIEKQELLSKVKYDLKQVPEVEHTDDHFTKERPLSNGYINEKKYLSGEVGLYKDPLSRLKKIERSSSDETLGKAQRNIHIRTVDKHLLSSLQVIPKHTNTYLPGLSVDKDKTNSQYLEPVVVIAQSQLLDASTDDDVILEHTQTCCGKIRSSHVWHCDWSIFRNKNYVPLLMGGVLIQMAQFIPNTFLPDYCLVVGLSSGQMSLIIALYGAANIVGRFSAGCLTNFRRIDALWLCNFGMFMCGVGCVLFPLCKTYTSLIIYALAVGYFIGYFPPLQVLIMVEHLGADNLSAALGFLQMAKGPAALLGPPLAGVVYQQTKTYTTSIVFAAILFLLSAGIQSLVPIASCITRCRRRNQRDTKNDITIEVKS
ncbi:hypothetical protein ACF0H5_015340 [Mactra antiquata]